MYICLEQTERLIKKRRTMITIKIKENSKQAKAVIELLKTYSFVEIVPTKVLAKSKQTQLDRLIKNSEKQIKEGKTTTLNTKDIWGSLGLK